jgi:predicted permease
MLAELLSDIRYRLRATFRRDEMERELADELRAHMERETDKLVRGGMPVDEARRRAQLAFGGVERIKDDARDARGLAWIDIATQEIRYTTRALRARPGFTLAVVATLALGIGANAAMFGIVDRMLFRAPQYLRDPSSVGRVYLGSTFRGTEYVGEALEFPRYQDLTRWTSSFSQFAAIHIQPTGVGTGDASREMSVGVASATFFEFFNLRPALGRLFTAADDALPAGERVAVVSYGYWQVEDGGRRDIIGSKIQIGPVDFTVIGVAPRGFAGINTGDAPVAWVPLTSWASLRGPNFTENYSWGWLTVVARRKPGVSVASATADLSAAYQRSWLAQRAIEPAMPTIESAKPHAVFAPTQTERGPNAGPEARGILLVGAMAIVVLLVACANVANLLLARGVARRREIAVRLAMGVSRSRLLGHLIAESMLLALLGAVAGLLVARLVGGSLNALFGENAGNNVSPFDTRTLLYCVAITIGVGVLTGMLPAFHAGRSDVLTDLRSGARDSGYRRSRTRSVLVVVQAALCVILLVGAGLFVRSLINVRSLPLGYDADHVVYAQRNMRGVKLNDEQSRELMRRLVDGATTLPGVVSAATAASVPFYDHESTRLAVPGIDSVSRLGRFQMQRTSADYFTTVGTRILAGRGITVEDRRDSPRVIVVSQTMAKKLWPGKSGLGECVRVGSDTMPCSTVVGIAEDIKERHLSHEAEGNYYIVADQTEHTNSGMYVRVRGDGESSADPVRRGLQRLMPAGAYVTATPLSELIGGQQRGWKVGATIFIAFGILALTLGAIGLYSVIAFGVQQRSRELSIRIALGARVRGILGMVMGEGVRLAVIGVAMGAGLSLLSARSIATLLFDEPANDPLVFSVVAIVLLVVSIAASAIPAYRATRLDPNVALRAD